MCRLTRWILTHQHAYCQATNTSGTDGEKSWGVYGGPAPCTDLARPQDMPTPWAQPVPQCPRMLTPETQNLWDSILLPAPPQTLLGLVSQKALGEGTRADLPILEHASHLFSLTVPLSTSSSPCHFTLPNSGVGPGPADPESRFGGAFERAVG